MKYVTWNRVHTGSRCSNQCTNICDHPDCHVCVHIKANPRRWPR